MHSVDYTVDDTKEMLKLALQKLDEIETCVRPLRKPAGVWISCKNQEKPIQWETVYVHHRSGYTTAKYMNGHWVIKSGTVLHTVTHWMRIPDLPED